MPNAPDFFGVASNVNLAKRFLIRVITPSFEILHDTRCPVNKEPGAPPVCLVLPLFQKPALIEHFHLRKHRTRPRPSVSVSKQRSSIGVCESRRQHWNRSKRYKKRGKTRKKNNARTLSLADASKTFTAELARDSSCSHSNPTRNRQSTESLLGQCSPEWEWA